MLKHSFEVLNKVVGALTLMLVYDEDLSVSILLTMKNSIDKLQTLAGIHGNNADSVI